MKVDIEEIRKAIDLLLDHVQADVATKVDLSNDYYWSIPRAARIDAYKEPSEFTLGQLSDDLVEIRRIANNETEPHAYALVWLASVLREVGEQLVK